VAYTCNPSYSGGRDQEDHGSKPSQVNTSSTSTAKKKKKKLRGFRKLNEHSRREVTAQPALGSSEHVQAS
jgi:hypothetical protein